jgi:hypothetical protein
MQLRDNSQYTLVLTVLPGTEKRRTLCSLLSLVVRELNQLVSDGVDVLVEGSPTRVHVRLHHAAGDLMCLYKVPFVSAPSSSQGRFFVAGLLTYALSCADSQSLCSCVFLAVVVFPHASCPALSR